MDEILPIGSLTYAQKAKRALAARGLHARLVKTDSAANGCTYALAIPAARYLDAVAILRVANIPYRAREL